MYQLVVAISSHDIKIDPLAGAFKINSFACAKPVLPPLSISTHYLLLPSFLFMTPFLFTVQPLI